MPVTVTARSIKVVLVLNAHEVQAALQPLADVSQRVPMTVSVEGRRLKADFAPKAIRKALAMLNEHGTEGVTIMIQGKLGAGDALLEAGLVAQPKAPRTLAPAAAPS